MQTCVRFCSAEQKSITERRADCGSWLAGLGAAADNANSHAKRAGFQFTRHHANCYYLVLTCNGRLHKLPGARCPECLRIDPH